MTRAISAALLALALCGCSCALAGCGAREAGAEQRFEVACEDHGTWSVGTVTDTETGASWVVVSTARGTAMERLHATRVLPSEDWGE